MEPTEDITVIKEGSTVEQTSELPLPLADDVGAMILAEITAAEESKKTFSPEEVGNLLKQISAVPRLVRGALIKSLSKVSNIKVPDLNAELSRIVRESDKAKMHQEINVWWEELGFTIPAAYGLSADGILLYGQKTDVQLTTHPFWVNCFVQNLTEGIEEVELAWKSSQGVRTLILPKSTLYRPQELVLTANQGVPLVPTQCGKLADFIAHFAKENEAHLVATKKILSRRPGWVVMPDGSLEFGVYSDLVMFKAPQSMASVEEHLTKKGSLAGWMQLKPLIQKAELLPFFIAAAAAAPLLELLRTNGFIVDQCGKSSTGKTTTLRLVASVFGRPGGQNDRGLVVPWNETPTFLEEVLGFGSHLPQFRMDSHDLKDEPLERIAYMVANGAGKGRGAKEGGVRARNEWKSVILSDGESSIYERLTQNGAKARIISIDKAGCTGLDSDDVAVIGNVIQENYGVVAPLLIQKAKELAGELLGIYKTEKAFFAGRAKTQIQGRIGDYFAGILTAARVLSQVEGMDWFQAVAVTSILTAWDIAEREIAEETTAKIMLQKVADWVFSKRNCFLTSSASKIPVGAQNLGKIKEGEYVAFYKAELDRYLATHNVMSTKMLLNEWKADGTLVTSGASYWKQVKVQGQNKQMIQFKWDALFPQVKEDTAEIVVASNVVTFAPKGLASATGRILRIQEIKDCTKEDEIATYVELENHQGFRVDPSYNHLLEKLAGALTGEESPDSVTVFYQLDRDGLNYLREVIVHKGSAQVPAPVEPLPVVPQTPPTTVVNISGSEREELMRNRRQAFGE